MKITKGKLKQMVVEEIKKHLDEYDLEKMARYEPSAAAHLAQKRKEKGAMSAADLEAEKAKKFKLARQKEKAAQASGGDDRPDWLMEQDSEMGTALENAAVALGASLSMVQGAMEHENTSLGNMPYIKRDFIFLVKKAMNKHGAVVPEQSGLESAITEILESLLG